MELLDNQLSLEVIPIYDTLWGVDDNGDSLYMLNEFVTECGCYKLFNFKINQSSLADVETITLNGMSVDSIRNETYCFILEEPIPEE